MEGLRRLPPALRRRVLWYALRCQHDVRNTDIRWYCRLCGEPCYDKCMHLSVMHPEDTGCGAAPHVWRQPGGWVCPPCHRARCGHHSTGMKVACSRCILNGVCGCCS